MTEAEQIEALKERLEHWQHKFDELAAENDRLRAELEAVSVIIKRLQEKYDENGYALPMTTTLERIDKAIEAGFSIWVAEHKNTLAELEAIRARVPSDGMIDAAAFVDSTNEVQATGFHIGARWMRDRIFQNENK